MKNHSIMVICIIFFASHTTTPIKQVSPAFAIGGAAGALLTVGAYGFIYRQTYPNTPKENRLHDTPAQGMQKIATFNNPFETAGAINENIKNLKKAKELVSDFKALKPDALCLSTEYDPKYTETDDQEEEEMTEEEEEETKPKKFLSYFQVRFYRTTYSCTLANPIEHNPIITLKSRDLRDRIFKIEYNAFLALNMIVTKFKTHITESTIYLKHDNDALIRYIDEAIQQEQEKLSQAATPVNNQTNAPQPPKATTYSRQALVLLGCTPLAYWSLYFYALAHYHH